MADDPRHPPAPGVVLPQGRRSCGTTACACSRSSSHGHHPGPDGGDLQAVLERVPQGRHRAGDRHPRRRRRWCRPAGRRRRRSRPTMPARRTVTASWVGTFLNARAGTIYAGSSQIQRNIIGEMVLGLPKEPQARTCGAELPGRLRRGASRAGRALWPTALRQMRGARPRRGWWRAPAVPAGADRRLRALPARRRSTATADHRIEPADVVNYLAWCRAGPAVSVSMTRCRARESLAPRRRRR